LPIQILWINLITDGFPALALTLEPGEKEIMKEPPQERDKPIIDKERKILIVTISLVTGLVNLGVFYFIWQQTGDLVIARSVVFTTLSISSLLYIFSCRSMRHSLFKMNFFKNKYLLAAVILGGLFQVMAIYLPFFQGLLKTTPLYGYEWSFILSVSFLAIFVIELIKMIFISRMNKEKRIIFNH
jgi:Ca2+-transporting ATPase